MSRSCSCRVTVWTWFSSSKVKLAVATPLESTVVIWLRVERRSEVPSVQVHLTRVVPLVASTTPKSATLTLNCTGAVAESGFG